MFAINMTTIVLLSRRNLSHGKDLNAYRPLQSDNGKIFDKLGAPAQDKKC
jgi:hypothetical protein